MLETIKTKLTEQGTWTGLAIAAVGALIWERTGVPAETVTAAIANIINGLIVLAGVVKVFIKG